MNKTLYLDYAATTPLDSRVLDAMLPFLKSESGGFGNPSSSHPYGLKAKAAIEKARIQVAELIGADSCEIIWTSGATESNNLAIKGAAHLYQAKGKHIITVKTEHPSVLETCQYLEKQGYDVTYLSPEKSGILSVEVLEKALREDTILVSIMYVNNETGVIQDIAKIADLTSARNILLHVDAVQAVGKLPIHLKSLPVDLMSFTAHKLYGPKGIGGLYLRQRPRVRVEPQIHGGSQELGMRSGTLATHQIVGMGEAFAIAKNEMANEQKHIFNLRKKLLQKLKDKKDFFLISEMDRCIPNILNFGFRNLSANEMIARNPHVAISKGAACAGKGVEYSYVLRSMGIEKKEAECAVRLSLGRFTTDEDIDFLNAQFQI